MNNNKDMLKLLDEVTDVIERGYGSCDDGCHCRAGRKGRRGDRGPIGDDGDKGFKGIQGTLMRDQCGCSSIDGDRGSKGPKGPRGNTGCRGDGEIGPIGPKGRRGPFGESYVYRTQITCGSTTGSGDVTLPTGITGGDQVFITVRAWGKGGDGGEVYNNICGGGGGGGGYCEVAICTENLLSLTYECGLTSAKVEYGGTGILEVGYGKDGTTGASGSVGGTGGICINGRGRDGTAGTAGSAFKEGVGGNSVDAKGGSQGHLDGYDLGGGGAGRCLHGEIGSGGDGLLLFTFHKPCSIIT
jgi:hypothetical protein